MLLSSINEFLSRLIHSYSYDRCSRCSAPDEGYTVCRACGYYAKLGEFVELDPEMEGFEDEAEDKLGFTIPAWFYTLAAVNLLLLIESIVVVMVLPEFTYERLTISLLHLTVGIVLMLASHLRATFWAMMDDTEVTAVDCIAWPPRAWEAVAARLPDSSPQITMLTTGLMALLMSLIVIRSVPYGALLHSDQPPPKYDSMLQQVVQQAKVPAKPGNMSMNEAIQSFTEDAALTGATQGESDELLGSDDAQAGLPQPSQAPLQTARCIVVGYLPNAANPNAIDSIVVATASRFNNSRSKFEILGTISVAGTDYAAELMQQLQGTQQASPFVDSRLPAVWVKPRVRCEVEYREQGANRQPINLALKDVLAGK
jgi:hypothetical protein